MSPANPSGTNTLALATSPYLRQHADNPVHWQQWTPQALAEAAARAVPILLSVGYAACHWCHVMAHESFDDDEVAAAMNAGFVCIKVDREERPDIDAVYMNATVALTGQEVLGGDDGRWAAEVFGVTEAGTFEHGTSVLQLPADPDDAARLDRVRAALLVARLARAQPARDDKVVTSWNGLAITALAEASVALDDPALAHAARRCATRLLDLHVVDGRLRRASLGGVVGDSAAILEDHAMLATGLLALYQLTSEGAWLTAATGLLDTAVAHFGDPQRPGRWFDTADDAERLMLRPSDPLDGATPSGASSIAEALLTAGHVVDGARAERYWQLAADTLRAHAVLLARAPRSAGHWLAVAEAVVRGPLQIAVACDLPRSSLLADARRLAPGGAIVVGGAAGSSALLVGRDRVAGADAAYVCRGRVCDLPVTSAAELATALGVPG